MPIGLTVKMLEGRFLELGNDRLDQPKAMDPYAPPSRMEQTGHASSSVMVIPRTQAWVPWRS